MTDATLSQGHRLLGLILEEKDPRDFAQNLHASWGLVRQIGRGEINQAMITEALKHINPYADERVEPRYFYPEGYKPNLVEEQASILLTRLDWLDTSHVAEIAASWLEYEQADGLYVVPKPTVLAAKLGIQDPWTNFGYLIEQGPIAALVAIGRKFTNYRAGQLGPEYYHLNGQVKSELALLEAQQSGDVIVFPAQTGRVYAGYSVRNSRVVIQQAENPSQWPLTSYAIGWMLYANPHRLTAYEHLAIDCPGDEYSWYADGQFEDSLYFYVYGGRLYLDSRLLDNADERFGSASGFSRQ